MAAGYKPVEISQTFLAILHFTLNHKVLGFMAFSCNFFFALQASTGMGTRKEQKNLKYNIFHLENAISGPFKAFYMLKKVLKKKTNSGKNLRSPIPASSINRDSQSSKACNINF